MTIVTIAYMTIVIYIVKADRSAGGAVKVSREQVAKNRQRILDVAGKLFREKGFDGVGVDEIMEESGLTHGGFYGHFASKADLADQACAAAIGRSVEKWEALARGPPEARVAEIVRSYLSTRHRDDPGSGCILATLGAEAARRSDAVRATVTNGVRVQLEFLANASADRSQTERREQAITTLSGLVGAMVLGRLVDDPALSNEILTGAAAAFGGNAGRRDGR
jgi:TetR/AcrR family transcriptional regulator, transcriptional repressor for nem operon